MNIPKTKRIHRVCNKNYEDRNKFFNQTLFFCDVCNREQNIHRNCTTTRKKNPAKEDRNCFIGEKKKKIRSFSKV